MKRDSDPRHEARKLALQALFEWSYNSTDIRQICERDIVDYAKLDREGAKIEVDRDLVFSISNGVTENLDTIDKIIEAAAPEWPIAQIAPVDRNVLRVGLY